MWWNLRNKGSPSNDSHHLPMRKIYALKCEETYSRMLPHPKIGIICTWGRFVHSNLMQLTQECFPIQRYSSFVNEEDLCPQMWCNLRKNGSQSKDCHHLSMRKICALKCDATYARMVPHQKIVIICQWGRFGPSNVMKLTQQRFNIWLHKSSSLTNYDYLLIGNLYCVSFIIFECTNRPHWQMMTIFGWGTIVA